MNLCKFEFYPSIRWLFFFFWHRLKASCRHQLFDAPAASLPFFFVIMHQSRLDLGFLISLVVYISETLWFAELVNPYKFSTPWTIKSGIVQYQLSSRIWTWGLSSQTLSCTFKNFDVLFLISLLLLLLLLAHTHHLLHWIFSSAIKKIYKMLDLNLSSLDLNREMSIFLHKSNNHLYLIRC